MGPLVDNKINKCFERSCNLLTINISTDTNVHTEHTLTPIYTNTIKLSGMI